MRLDRKTITSCTTLTELINLGLDKSENEEHREWYLDARLVGGGSEHSAKIMAACGITLSEPAVYSGFLAEKIATDLLARLRAALDRSDLVLAEKTSTELKQFAKRIKTSRAYPGIMLRYNLYRAILARLSGRTDLARHYLNVLREQGSNVAYSLEEARLDIMDGSDQRALERLAQVKEYLIGTADEPILLPSCLSLMATADKNHRAQFLEEAYAVLTVNPTIPTVEHFQLLCALAEVRLSQQRFTDAHHVLDQTQNPKRYPGFDLTGTRAIRASVFLAEADAFEVDERYSDYRKLASEEASKSHSERSVQDCRNTRDSRLLRYIAMAYLVQAEAEGARSLIRSLRWLNNAEDFLEVCGDTSLVQRLAKDRLHLGHTLLQVHLPPAMTFEKAKALLKEKMVACLVMAHPCVRHVQETMGITESETWHTVRDIDKKVKDGKITDDHITAFRELFPNGFCDRRKT